MKRWFLVFALLFLGGCVWGQARGSYTSLAEVRNPESVVSLKLNYKHLKHMPVEIRKMTNLEELDLSKNKIDTLPSWIGELKSLRVLKLGRNRLYKLPAELSQLDSLKVLDINRNPLFELPDELGTLPQLERLIMWSTEIRYLPPTFVLLDGVLKRLDMRDCPMSKDQQDEIDSILPNTEKVWDQACNCR